MSRDVRFTLSPDQVERRFVVLIGHLDLNALAAFGSAELGSYDTTTSERNATTGGE
jgi:hypothetical protein